MIRIAVAGAAGRMGRRIIALARQDERLAVAAALEMEGHPMLGSDAGVMAGLGPINLPITPDTQADFDVLIDFSQPSGTIHWLSYCVNLKKPILIGTTGHTTEQRAMIEAAGKDIAVLHAANTSVGVNLLLKLVAQVAVALGDDYDIEITETHHRFKLDAPSGTALALRDAITQATGRDSDRDVIYGRHGRCETRPPRQIGIHALRVGDTVGEHEVHFGNLGETLVLRHSAHTRDTFVVGALRAAVWLADKPAGRYGMNDVLESVQQ